MPAELRAAIVLFASLLDERQRRLFAGLESLKCGWGGDRRIAGLLGIDPATVSTGRRQLVERDVDLDRVRRVGGGRPPAEKNAGSHRPPRSPDGARNGRRPGPRLKWTRRTTAKIAAELRTLGIDVCARTVARLLKTMGFSLRVNHKKLAGASHPNRDDQFQRITALRQRCAVENTPMISVDTKKKELVGAFKNAGAKWDRVPELVKDHDFRSEAEGRAIPYGIYDPQANTGTVFVGATADTPAFAVDCIEKWWRTEGRKRYPQAETLQILADSGGSNGCTPRAWKFHLQHRLCNRHRLRVTVAHYPPPRPSGIPSNTGCFVKSAKTGPAALSTV